MAIISMKMVAKVIKQFLTPERLNTIVRDALKMVREKELETGRHRFVKIQMEADGEDFRIDLWEEWEEDGKQQLKYLRSYRKLEAKEFAIQILNNI